jgi:hypothetical protein
MEDEHPLVFNCGDGLEDWITSHSAELS